MRPDDVRVSKAMEGAGLVDEAVEAPGEDRLAPGGRRRDAPAGPAPRSVVGEILLERDRSVQLVIERQVRDAEAARAEHADDLVLADAVALRQRGGMLMRGHGIPILQLEATLGPISDLSDDRPSGQVAGDAPAGGSASARDLIDRQGEANRGADADLVAGGECGHRAGWGLRPVHEGAVGRMQVHDGERAVRRGQPEVLAGRLGVVEDDPRLRRIAADDDAVGRPELLGADLDHHAPAVLVAAFQQARERRGDDRGGEAFVGRPARRFGFLQLHAPTLAETPRGQDHREEEDGADGEGRVDRRSCRANRSSSPAASA